MKINFKQLKKAIEDLNALATISVSEQKTLDEFDVEEANNAIECLADLAETLKQVADDARSNG